MGNKICNCGHTKEEHIHKMEGDERIGCGHKNDGVYCGCLEFKQIYS